MDRGRDYITPSVDASKGLPASDFELARVEPPVSGDLGFATRRQPAPDQILHDPRRHFGDAPLSNAVRLALIGMSFHVPSSALTTPASRSSLPSPPAVRATSGAVAFCLCCEGGRS